MPALEEEEEEQPIKAAHGTLSKGKYFSVYKNPTVRSEKMGAARVPRAFAPPCNRKSSHRSFGVIVTE